MASTTPQTPILPPTKADKPKSHVCTVCFRTFNRSEHVLRHVRSHTQEKPFACSECGRCFSRRDLLLRHQQKLHVGSTNPRRIRKNSASTSTPQRTRPRANTVSNIQESTVGLPRSLPVENMTVLNEALSQPIRDEGVIVSDMAPSLHNLPRLETSNLYGEGPHTAPVYGFINPSDLLMDGLENINPSQLHVDGLQDIGAVDRSFHQLPNFYLQNQWTGQQFAPPDFFGEHNELAIDDSPSATNSPPGTDDGVNYTAGHTFPGSVSWSCDRSVVAQLQAAPGNTNVDLREPGFDDLMLSLTSTFLDKL